MISVLLAIAVLGQQPQTPNQANPKPDGALLISKMFQYYSASKSMVGEIKYTQKSGNVAVTLDTTVEFESPSKLYLKQTLNSSQPMSWLVTSDGKVFSYDYPNRTRKAANRPETGRLMEAVNPNGQAQTYQQIFRAATESLGDISVPLLVAFGGSDEFAAVKDQFVTVQDMGTDTVDGQSVHVLGGDWRIDHYNNTSGKYKIYITDEGELKRYSQHEIVQIDKNAAPADITTTWDVSLHPNAKPDESLFKVVK